MRHPSQKADIHQDAFVKPARECQAHALALLSLLVHIVGQSFDPAELPVLLAFLHADIRDDGGCLKAAERFPQR